MGLLLLMLTQIYICPQSGGLIDSIKLGGNYFISRLGSSILISGMKVSSNSTTSMHR